MTDKQLPKTSINNSIYRIDVSHDSIESCDKELNKLNKIFLDYNPFASRIYNVDYVKPLEDNASESIRYTDAIALAHMIGLQEHTTPPKIPVFEYEIKEQFSAYLYKTNAVWYDEYKSLNCVFLITKTLSFRLFFTLIKENASIVFIGDGVQEYLNSFIKYICEMHDAITHRPDSVYFYSEQEIEMGDIELLMSGFLITTLAISGTTGILGKGLYRMVSNYSHRYFPTSSFLARAVEKYIFVKHYK